MNIININNVSQVVARGTPEIITSRINTYEQLDFEKMFQEALEKKDDKALRKSCMEMEKIFLAMIFKQMKATIPKSRLVPEYQGAEILESMIDEAFVEEMAKSNSFGLAKMLYEQLK